MPDGGVDLALEKNGVTIALEISVTNEVDYEVANLTKCLAAGFTLLLMVCADDAKLKRLQDAALKALPEPLHQRLACCRSDDVPALLQSVGGDGAQGMEGGRKVTVKHSGTGLEDDVEARRNVAKAVADAMKKQKTRKRPNQGDENS